MFEPLNRLARGFLRKASFQTDVYITNNFINTINKKRLNLKLNLFVMHRFSLKELLCVKSPLQGDLGVQTRVFFPKKIKKNFCYTEY